MSEWISVDEQLPDRAVGVLVWGTADYRGLWHVDIGQWFGDHWRLGLANVNTGQVTHWQPLPPPPEATP